MKKRLICLLVCLTMLFSLVLASCSSKSEEETKEEISNAASETAKTLTMWVVSEEKVSTEAANAVTEAINAITNAKFKTQLVLNFLTKDEYRSKLESTIIAYEEGKKNQATVETQPQEPADTGDTTPVTDETETNEYGLTVVKYPEPEPNQVDIIYIAGEDMYIDFIEKGWLQELDTELSSTSKKIKEYVSSTLLSAVKYNGTTYAIPNNRVIGDYTYMMVNKELAKMYSQEGYIQYGQIDGFFNENLYLYLKTIYEIHSKIDPNVIPIDSTYEECLDLLAHYWSFDTDTYDMVDEFSIFGSHYKDMESLSRGSVVLGYGNLFEDKEFADAFLQLNEFKFGTDDQLGSYFGDASATGKTAAVKFAKGDSTILTYNKEEGAYEYVEVVDGKEISYYPIVVKYPTASSDDIYGNMFGVCSHSAQIGRSMQIVTYLNTNADFRNLLQYGIEGTHYDVQEDADGKKTVKRLNNDYMMDIYATGNVFIAYPEPEMSADIWESGKVQNRYSLVEPLLGLNFAEFSASTGETPSAVTLPKIGYTYSYTTGYSKDVLGQNEILSKWFADCDAAGKGVYILPTEVIVGQDRTINYYVYNNDLTKRVDFAVEDIRVVEEQIDEKGKKTEVQTDLDFVFGYSDTAESSKSGYEVSLVKLYTRKSNQFEIKVQVGNDFVEPVISNARDLLEFDFFHTEGYTIDLYEKLRKPAFMKNAMLDEWIGACDNKGVKVPTTFVMEYSQEKNGKMEYTYVVYRTGLKCVTNTQIVPTGDNDEVNVAFHFTHNEDERLDTATEATYLLHYVRVTVDKGVDVSFTVTSNGKVDNIKTENKELPNSDPDFKMIGNLDTELVKFLQNLNDELLAELNKCQTYDEVVKLVTEMRKLLITTEEYASVSQFEILKPLVEKYSPILIGQYLKDAVATTTTPKVDSEGEEKTHRGEPFVYFDSPNTIYHKWLTQFGYKPAEKK